MSSRDRGRGRGQKHSGSVPPISSGIGKAERSSSQDHRRNNSEEKKKKMRASLGGSDAGIGSRDPSGPKPKTHLLVICGGEHTAFLGDLLGLVEFFQKKVSPTFKADYMTVYTPEEYFASKRGADFDVIKFDGQPILSRHAQKHYDQPYEYVDPSQICIRLYQWIAMKADPDSEHGAKSGDSIDIILIAHGVWSEEIGTTPIGMRLGTNNLVVGDFVDALRAIPRDIQVNVISTACYSAVFAQKIKEDEQAARWILSAAQPEMRVFAAERSMSGRLQNSAFIAGLVRSLAGLGKSNLIQLGALQTDLTKATQKHSVEENRSVPFSYTDSSSTTKVHSLLLRKYADFPFTPENSAARRRKELNIAMHHRDFPDSAATMDKTDFAIELIRTEHESFGSQSTLMDEESFEEVTRFEKSRRAAAPSILRGMFVRGRLQAAVFDVFLELCLAGVCSLNALQHPVKWVAKASPGTSLSWIFQMLGIFSGATQDWGKVQDAWGIEKDCRWYTYSTPINWLATMIARSFTSLDRVFDIIRLTKQLGSVDRARLSKMVSDSQPDTKWMADMNTNRAEKFTGSGTFACWLPENVDTAILEEGFDEAAIKLSRDFQEKLDRMEMHYAAFFDIPRKVLESDALDGERDVRDWKPDGVE